MCRLRGKRALGGGNSKCKGPEAGAGINLVPRHKKRARVAGRLDREGQEEMMLVSQDAKVGLFSA